MKIGIEMKIGKIGIKITPLSGFRELWISAVLVLKKWCPLQTKCKLIKRPNTVWCRSDALNYLRRRNSIKKINNLWHWKSQIYKFYEIQICQNVPLCLGCPSDFQVRSEIHVHRPFWRTNVFSKKTVFYLLRFRFYRPVDKVEIVCDSVWILLSLYPSLCW